MSDISSLPLMERAKRYRTLSVDALAEADKVATPNLRRSYLEIASGWTALADQTDAILTKSNNTH